MNWIGVFFVSAIMALLIAVISDLELTTCVAGSFYERAPLYAQGPIR
jgi:hypothetical protein